MGKYMIQIREVHVKASNSHWRSWYRVCPLVAHAPREFMLSPLVYTEGILSKLSDEMRDFM
jgi:hypothetical protein